MGGKGSGGHNRKSIEQHIAEGTYRRDRHGESYQGHSAAKLADDPVSNLGIKPSSWLPERAKELFNDLAPQLIKLGTLDFLSLRLFEALCVTWSQIRDIDKIIEKEGTVIEDAKGRRKPHLLLSEQKRCEKLFMDLCKDFGMTPAARIKMGLPELKNKDIFGDLLG